MTTETVTPATTGQATASEPLNSGWNEGRHDQLCRLSDQLGALIASMAGAGYKNFSECSEEVQQNLLWLASDLAEQMRAVVRQPEETTHG